ncbi:right-handed parallel beta-helix repeat-containing protein [Ruminococcus sp.]|uniref:right-handed parallel beta-helix repeat-containing protein n=1 Tax=Ruminococcus sp. TaxID=41978 RepID=UPI0025D6D702|nr:right-handed parallel beta-helix repeat-containing protein [Ruminococcus sp.]
MSGRFMLTASAYDYSVISGSHATGANISGYDSAIAVSVTDLGADPTGKKDSSAAIQKALDYAKTKGSDSVQVKVIVPEGTYSVRKGLYVSSNTWLYLDNATLRKDFIGGVLLMNNTDGHGGFDGARNIVIEGGCLDGNTGGGSVKAFSAIRMGHLHDLWVKNVEFKDNYNCHMLELGGIKNVTIEGCSFHEYYGQKFKEAIQFDILNNANLFDGYAPFDDTSCDNVIIRNNSFYDIMRGVGSHSATVGKYYTNFYIADNTFSNIYETAIVMQNYRCCSIENNSMTGVGCGIDFKNMTSMEYSGYYTPVAGYDGVYDRINDFSDVVISNNTINANITGYCDNPYGISLYGKLVQNGSLPDHDYKVSGVHISSNNITTAGSAVQLNDATGVYIDSNVIGTPSDGDKSGSSLVSLKFSNDVTVSGNSIIGSSSDAISILGGKGGVIKKNSCLYSAGSGISADKSAEVTISGNTVENSSQSGIYIAGKSKAEVSKNTVKTSFSGVAVEGASGINITDNTITGCTDSGIFAAEGSSAYVNANNFVENKCANYKGEVYAMPVTAFAADGIYGDHVQLSWKSKGGSDGFSIKRRLAGSEEDFTEVAQVSTPSFSDESLPQNTVFEYRVDSLLDTGDTVTESSSKVLNIRTKASLSGCTCDIRPVYRFTGRHIEPDINVTLHGAKLVRNVDYIIKYYNNISVGTATISVTGCGQYYGFKEFEFEISLSEGYVLAERASNDLNFAGDSIERYEVLAFSPDSIPNLTAPIANRESDSPLIAEINSAKNTDELRIVSRRMTGSAVMPCFDAWY